MSYTLVRSAITTEPVSSKTAWAVQLTVETDDEPARPSKVFVYQAEDPSDPNTRGWFTAVASPAQLEEYPEDAPAAPSSAGSDSVTVQQPYYRLDTVTLISRNASDIETLVDKIQGQLEVLSRNLDAIDSMTLDEEIVIA